MLPLWVPHISGDVLLCAEGPYLLVIICRGCQCRGPAGTLHPLCNKLAVPARAFNMTQLCGVYCIQKNLLTSELKQRILSILLYCNGSVNIRRFHCVKWHVNGCSLLGRVHFMLLCRSFRAPCIWRQIRNWNWILPQI